MTTGALIFAFNNADIDYVEMSAWSAHRIKKYLNIPVAVVTNSTTATQYASFDQVINTELTWDGHHRYFTDLDKSVPWYNANRVDAYQLTPWDKTLVLDADYVVNSTSLSSVLKCNEEFMCYRHAQDVRSVDNWDLNYFGTCDFPMWWATVMMFQKSPMAQHIFNSMSMIRNNWQHYRDLYGIAQSQYRNDYALSISLGLVSGHTLTTTNIAGSILTLTPEVELTTGNQPNEFNITWQDISGKRKRGQLVDCDFHAMGKKQLGGIIEADRRAGLFNTSH
jgi:hypothetical protein